MRISDWSSDVCSSDLKLAPPSLADAADLALGFRLPLFLGDMAFADRHRFIIGPGRCLDMLGDDRRAVDDRGHHHARRIPAIAVTIAIVLIEAALVRAARVRAPRIGAAIILAAA